MRCGLLPNNTTLAVGKSQAWRKLWLREEHSVVLLGFFRAAVTDSWCAALAEGSALNWVTLSHLVNVSTVPLSQRVSGGWWLVSGFSPHTHHWSGCTLNPVLFWVSHYKKDMEVPEWIQRSATELMKILEYQSDKKQLKELRVFSLEKRRIKVTFSLNFCCNINYNYLKWSFRQVEVGLFSQTTSDRTRGESLQLHHGKIRLFFRKMILTKIVVKHWNRLPK